MATAAEPTRVVWAPQAGSQVLALSCPANHILYDGTRGPGKSDTQLMRFRMRVGVGYGPFWRGVIFDREYKALDDLVAKSLRWFYEFGDGAKFIRGTGAYRWVWPTGEELLFRQIKRRADYYRYHGQEFPFIGWNELTKYPTSELYDLMMSCNRSSFVPAEHPLDDGTLLPEIPLEVFATTNPFGPGHVWVKRQRVDPAPPGVTTRQTTRVFNPRTKQEEDVTRTYCRIFGSYRENRFLSPQYVAELHNIKDPNIRRAWLGGDWNVAVGGALDDLWGDHLLLPRFKIPKGWRIDRSLDWGSTHPFSVGWWAEANGEEVQLPDGRWWAPARGSLIQIAEWYGAAELGTNAGLKLSAKRVAQGIKEREVALLKGGWISTRPAPGPADNQIADVREVDVDTIEKKMADEGVHWTRSDKSPGSRKIGLQLIRDRMEAAQTGEGPAIYFMRHCAASIGTLPILPRDEVHQDDVDTDAEDHPYDMTRYRVLAGNNRGATTIHASTPT